MSENTITPKDIESAINAKLEKLNAEQKKRDADEEAKKLSSCRLLVRKLETFVKNPNVTYDYKYIADMPSTGNNFGKFMNFSKTVDEFDHSTECTEFRNFMEKIKSVPNISITHDKIYSENEVWRIKSIVSKDGNSIDVTII